MEEFDLAEKVLADIIVNDTPFSEALRKVFQTDIQVRPLRSTVAGLVGCELRHHLLFSHLMEGFADYSDEDRLVLSLGLADLYFFRRIPAEQILLILQEKLGEAKSAEAKPLLDKAGKPEEYIPTDLPRTSLKYLSLRYNTPGWVLKIWEHYGYGVTYRILKKDNRQNTTSVRVRTSLISVDELLNRNQDYAKTPVEGMLYYGGKAPLRKLPEFREGKIFPERLATKAVLDKYKVEDPSEVFIYDGNADSSVLKEAIETYRASVGLNLGVKDLTQYVDVTRMIREGGLKNVNFFAADPSALEASISRPQDLVVCVPDSTNFDLIREYPDYLLHFKKDAMDAIFAQEKAALEGTSAFVGEHGILLYMIYTISKKEGHQTINDFVLRHPEFRIVEERQIFPFEDLDTSLYYCAMRKDTALAKANPPLPDLALSQMTASPQAGAMMAKPEGESPSVTEPEEENPSSAKAPIAPAAPQPVEKASEKPATPPEPAKAKPAEVKPAEAKPEEAKPASAPSQSASALGGASSDRTAVKS